LGQLEEGDYFKRKDRITAAMKGLEKGMAGISGLNLIPLMLVVSVLASCPLTDEIGLNETVENRAPEVFLEAGGPTEGEAPFYPQVRYGCSDPEDQVVSCEFKSDGQTIYKADVPPYPPPDSVSWPVYNESGKHTIEIVAVDSKGSRTSKQLGFTVKNAVPRAKLTANVTQGRVPFYPNFEYECWDPENRLKSCEIKNDGKTMVNWGAYPKNVSWPEELNWPPYREPGEHVMEITAIDDEGLSNSSSVTYFVSDTVDVYVETFPSSVDPIYKNAIGDAFSYWEGVHKIHFREVSAQTQDSIYAEWIKEYGGDVLGKAEIGGKNLRVGLGDSLCYGKFRTFKYESVVEIAKHELGHILGYEHSNDTNDLMYPINLGLKYETDVDEELVVPEGWNWFYPVCSRQNVSTYFFQIASDQPIDVYVIPSEEEYQKASKEKEFSYYKGCKAEDTNSFSRTCTLDTTGGIYIHYPYSGEGAATVHIKMQEE
jgi:hypothetical protein